jgi:hypothetical protein
MGYESTFVSQTVERIRAEYPAGRTPLSQRFYSPTLSEPLGQRATTATFSDCLPTRRLQSSRSQYLARFRYRRHRLFVPPSKVPKTLHSIWSKDHDEDLRALLHQSPRHLGQPTSLWTLDLVAQVCYQKGWTSRQLSGDALRMVLKRLQIRWKRAKHWISSPDPQYARKKKRGMN